MIKKKKIPKDQFKILRDSNGKALDQHGCDIVRDFFGKVLKAATLAAERIIYIWMARQFLI